MANIVFNKITIEGNSKSIINLLRVVKSEFYDFDPRRICEFYAESKNESIVYNARITDCSPDIDYAENQEICIIYAETAWILPELEVKILTLLFPDLKITDVFKSLDNKYQGFFIYQNGVEIESVCEDYKWDDEEVTK